MFWTKCQDHLFYINLIRRWPLCLRRSDYFIYVKFSISQFQLFFLVSDDKKILHLDAGAKNFNSLENEQFRSDKKIIGE